MLGLVVELDGEGNQRMGEQGRKGEPGCHAAMMKRAVATRQQQPPNNVSIGVKPEATRIRLRSLRPESVVLRAFDQSAWTIVSSLCV
jgi:hypothetical protein